MPEDPTITPDVTRSPSVDDWRAGDVLPPAVAHVIALRMHEAGDSHDHITAQIANRYFPKAEWLKHCQTQTHAKATHG